MYNKIFTKILDSSIWLESDQTRIVWLTLIAAMDESGFCAFASPRNLANRARVTTKACLEAIKRLESPDDESSDPDHEGRRIERINGGWIVLNAEKYRSLVTRAVAQERTRERVRRHREKRRVTPVTVSNASVTVANGSVTPSEAYTEAIAEAETDKSVDQDHRTDVRKSHKVLVKLAHQAITESESESEGIERTKELASKARIAYNSGAIVRAVEAALKQRNKAS